jgi:hypothetical protein
LHRGVTRLAVRLTVAAFVAAAVGLGVPGPAQAATCGTTNGVTVVVDFHQLGGGVQTACDLNGAGGHASTQFTDVGHTLTYAQRQPGFVCRVDGSPSSDPCINTSPANAYWSLWWSDGKSGTWSFSSQGVGSLTVPEGGYVALSWQGGDARAEPRVTPKAHPTASPTPTTSPTHASPSPTSHSSAVTPASSTSWSTTPSTATSSATPPGHHHGSAGHQRDGHHDGASQSPSTSPGASSNRADAPRAATAEAGGSGLPGWAAAGLVVLLFGAAGAVAVVRRKRPGGP